GYTPRHCIERSRDVSRRSRGCGDRISQFATCPGHLAKWQRGRGGEAQAEMEKAIELMHVVCQPGWQVAVSWRGNGRFEQDGHRHSLHDLSQKAFSGRMR